MPYIPPNSTIRLLQDVPIDDTYEHTLWFETRTAQTNYFISKTVRSFSENYYVRKDRGMIKLQAQADQLYNCNYLMYQNASYNNKWFYAFCTVEYINDNTCAVYFKLDELQTWFFEMRLGQCFVEREHTYTDVIGDNLVPENLETGEYIYSDENMPYMGGMKIVIASTVQWDSGTSQFINAAGGAFQGMYCGLYFTTFDFDSNGITACNNWLINLTNATKSDSIVSIFMCPEFFFAGFSSSSFTPNIISYMAQQKPLTFDGYVPRNNKLWTSPYVSLMVKTPNNAGEYGFEYFSNPNAPQFRLTSILSTQPSILLEPINYKTNKSYTTTKIDDNYVESMTLTGWPQCAYNIDAYKAWLAQNGPSLAVNGALAVASLGMSVASGYSPAGQVISTVPTVNPSTWQVTGYNQYVTHQDASFTPNAGMLGSIGAIGNLLAQVYQHSLLPPHARGSCDANAMFVRGRFNFIFCTKQIRPEFAEIIDNYFTKFGYACHKLKVPNIRARTRWTYTKTVDSIVTGNLPSDAVNTIQSIFNKGITFWVNANEVGNYTLDNFPLY